MVLLDEDGMVGVVSALSGLVLIGGGQGHGESPEDAALREAMEECGLRIALGGCLGIGDELVFAADERTHYRKRCTFFVGQVMEKVRPGEADHQFIWLPPADAIAGLRHGSQRWAVERALTHANAAPDNG